MKKKIIILDHYFKDYQGHHFNYNQYLNETMSKSHDLEFYVSKNIKKEIVRKFDNNLVKFFENDHINKKKFIEKFIEKIIKIIKKLRKIKIIKNLFYYILKRNRLIFNLALKYVFELKGTSNFITKLIEIDSKYSKTHIFLHSLSENEFFDFINNKNFFLKNENTYWIVYRRDPRELKFYLDYIKMVFKVKNFNLLTDSSKIRNFLKKKKYNRS